MSLSSLIPGAASDHPMTQFPTDFELRTDTHVADSRVIGSTVVFEINASENGPNYDNSRIVEKPRYVAEGPPQRGSDRESVYDGFTESPAKLSFLPRSQT